MHLPPPRKVPHFVAPDILFLRSFQLVQKALYQFTFEPLSSSTAENLTRRLHARKKIAAFRWRHRKHSPFKKAKFRQALGCAQQQENQEIHNTMYISIRNVARPSPVASIQEGAQLHA